MIEVKNLTKSYDNKMTAVNNVSFTLGKKITSIIGRNGAGKTTLLRILSTQLLPTSGTASIYGYDVVKEPEAIRNLIVSIPQEARPIYYRTVIDSIRIYLSARGIPMDEADKRARKALKTVGLEHIMNKQCGRLSGGMKRKTFVAMALASSARLVILDEPTTGLDPLSRFEVWSAIRSLKSDVIITTHYMEEAQQLSDEIIMMDGGKVFSQGSMESLLKPFRGMVRIESSRKLKGSYRIGKTWISYVSKNEAEGFVLEGDVIKPVTLDDLFIKKGVNLES